MEKKTEFLRREETSRLLINKPSFIDNVKKKLIEHKQKLMLGGGMFGGAIALLGLTSMEAPVDAEGNKLPVNKPNVDSEKQECTSVNDNMSFNEAFKTARIEHGADGYFVWKGQVYNTLYKDEMNNLSPEEQKEYYANIMSEYKEDHPEAFSTEQNIAQNTHSQPHEIAIVLYDEAPVAYNVNDSMSFNDAFAVARAEVGPGGIFHYHGQIYNTYTQEEYLNMSSSQKQEFIASVPDNVQPAEHNVSIADVNIHKIDQTEPITTTPATPTTTSNEVLIGRVVDEINGHEVHCEIYEVNGQQVLRIDHDNDGNFDTEICQDSSGNFQIETPFGGDTIPANQLQAAIASVDDLIVNPHEEPQDPEEVHEPEIDEPCYDEDIAMGDQDFDSNQDIV